LTILRIIHIILAVACLGIGIGIFYQTKGTKKHKTLGFLYLSALILVNITAYLITDQSGVPLSVIISIITLFCGFLPVLLRRPKKNWFKIHAYLMCWSYVVLFDAGASQLISKIPAFQNPLGFIVPTLIMIFIGARLINSKVPKILSNFKQEQLL